MYNISPSHSHYLMSILPNYTCRISLLPIQLRLLYECVPMAYIIEEAGGKATNGTKPILDIQPTSIHQRAPIFIGSQENVDDYLKIQEECSKKAKEEK